MSGVFLRPSRSSTWSPRAIRRRSASKSPSSAARSRAAPSGAPRERAPPPRRGQCIAGAPARQPAPSAQHSPAALLPCSPAALQPCAPAALQRRGTELTASQVFLQPGLQVLLQRWRYRQRGDCHGRSWPHQSHDGPRSGRRCQRALTGYLPMQKREKTRTETARSARVFP